MRRNDIGAKAPRRRTAHWIAAGSLSVTLLGACSTLPDGSGWGERVTLSPGWDHLRSAALAAARDPWTWAPLVGAAGLQAGHADARISRWAQRETPLFGSRANAATWSDDLRSVAVVADAATVLLAPSGDDPAGWVLDKARGYAVDLAAATAAIGTTHVLKSLAGRTRPDGSDDQSFPSGHATTAAAYDRLAARNLESLALTPGADRALDYGLDALTLATSWARIEAGAHYPSDTLVGIAIGNFSANLFKGAFMGQGDVRQAWAIEPQHSGLRLTWRMTY